MQLYQFTLTFILHPQAAPPILHSQTYSYTWHMLIEAYQTVMTMKPQCPEINILFSSTLTCQNLPLKVKLFLLHFSFIKQRIEGGSVKGKKVSYKYLRVIVKQSRCTQLLYRSVAAAAVTRMSHQAVHFHYASL